jgi:hypothetical protein
MENHSQDNQTTYSTDTVEEVVEKDGDEIISISEISEILGLEPKIVRRYLYRGTISTKKSEVLEWKRSKTLERERPVRTRNSRVFNKWRR